MLSYDLKVILMKKEQLADEIIKFLISENKLLKDTKIPTYYNDKRNLLRALMNIRPPDPISEEIIIAENELLKSELSEKEIVDPYDLPTVAEKFNTIDIPFGDKIVLWKGDITVLGADAIVNAANSKLLGCFSPLHSCIDNAIHSAAGILLRLECNEIMKNQGHDEPTGYAKMTKAYNLPSKYILHTVGPIIYNKVEQEDCKLLEACYVSCLNKASEVGDIETLAFCCISTGEFRFPKKLACNIAYKTVCQWLDNHPGHFERIVFNVFTEEDYDEYSRLFRND